MLILRQSSSPKGVNTSSYVGSTVADGRLALGTKKVLYFLVQTRYKPVVVKTGVVQGGTLVDKSKSLAELGVVRTPTSSAQLTTPS